METHLYPFWFLGAHTIFQLIFTVMTLVIGIYSSKVYSLTKKRNVKLFSIAFFLFSLHYFIESVLNILTHFNILTGNESLITGTYSHMLIFSMGLIVLLYLTLGFKKTSTFALMSVITLTIVFFSKSKLDTFYLLASIFLIYISYFYLKNYLKNKDRTSLVSFIAFVFLLFGYIHYFFSVNHEFFYALAHFFELFAYGLILLNLKLIKNVKKKE